MLLIDKGVISKLGDSRSVSGSPLQLHIVIEALEVVSLFLDVLPLTTLVINLLLQLRILTLDLLEIGLKSILHLLALFLEFSPHLNFPLNIILQLLWLNFKQFSMQLLDLFNEILTLTEKLFLAR